MVIRRNHPLWSHHPALYCFCNGGRDSRSQLHRPRNLSSICQMEQGRRPAVIQSSGFISAHYEAYLIYVTYVWQIFELSVKYMNHMCACMCIWLKVLGTRLRILQASADDTGEYICQVEDGPFPRQSSVSVSVTSSSSRKSPKLMTNRKVSMAITFTLQIINQTWHYVGRGCFIMLSNVIYLQL